MRKDTEQHIQLGRIEVFIDGILQGMPSGHTERPFIESVRGLVKARLDSLIGIWYLPRTHEEYVLRLEELGDVMNGDSPRAKELRQKAEGKLEDQRNQGLLPGTFGARLAFHRERLGLTQRDLALLIKEHPSEISRFEKNKRKPPIGMIDLISRKLLLPPSYTPELTQLAGYSPKV